jgi:CHAD domain-containing protein
MSYRIKTHGRISAELQRVADQEIAAAQSELQSLDEADAGEVIHETRKHFKRMRALMQLLREPLGVKTARAEQAFYRDTGREFRRLRDAQAQATTLEKIARRFFEKRRPLIVAAAQRVLTTEAQRALRVLVQKGRCAAVVASLREARGRVAGWQLGDYRWKDLRAALRRSYRRAREAWRHATAEPKPSALHEWRRRTKDLYYHICLCHSAAPNFMEEFSGELDVLSEFLGDDHDLVVLRTLLERHPQDVPAGQARDGFFKMVALRREELLDAAFDLAGRIFHESPDEFIDALDGRRNEHRQRHKKATRIAERLVDKH